MGLLEKPCLPQQSPFVCNSTAMVAPVKATRRDWKQELKELKAMLDEGILTQESSIVRNRRYCNERVSALETAYSHRSWFKHLARVCCFWRQKYAIFVQLFGQF